MGRIVFDYVWITVAIAVLFMVLGHFFPSLGSSSGAVTTVVAAMTTGQLYGQRIGEEVSSGFAWKTAAILTVVSLILGGLVIAGLHMSGIPLFPEDMAFGAGTWALIFGIGGLIALLVTRFAFRWGVKTGAKAAALRKGRDIT